jgi:hypothetical protein
MLEMVFAIPNFSMRGDGWGAAGFGIEGIS